MSFCIFNKRQWRRAGQTAMIIALAAGLNACIYVSQPFTKSQALEELPAEKDVIVSVTHVVLQKDRTQARRFWSFNQRVVDTLAENQGYLGHKLRLRLFSGEAWTMTVWEDRAALSRFVFGDVHDTAIMEAMSAVADGRSFTASVSVDQLPLSWDEAEELMDEKGRSLLDAGAPSY
ncbi:MAG: hypothetical protein ACPG30_04625 [Parvibaculales bacterium]